MAPKPRKTTSPEPVAMGGDVSDAGNDIIMLEEPYRALVRITGDSTLLFHRWQCDSVEAKARAPKGSAAKKTDDVESYVWRWNSDTTSLSPWDRMNLGRGMLAVNDYNGVICLPGEYLRGSLCSNLGAAKYQQDPRSPRKSALDLYRAGVIALTDLAPITTADGELAKDWDYLDRRRAVVSRSAITRERPAFRAGWSAEIEFLVTTPQYISDRLLHRTLTDAGRLVGVGDFRPSFGRFSVTHFEVLKP